MEIEELYRGWFVTAVPSDGYWRFQCHAPQGKICMYDKIYRTAEEAIIASKEFVDRDIAKYSLLKLLEEWLQLGRINSEEYLKSLDTVIRATHPASCWGWHAD